MVHIANGICTDNYHIHFYVWRPPLRFSWIATVETTSVKLQLPSLVQLDSACPSPSWGQCRYCSFRLCNFFFQKILIYVYGAWWFHIDITWKKQIIISLLIDHTRLRAFYVNKSCPVLVHTWYLNWIKCVIVNLIGNSIIYLNLWLVAMLWSEATTCR